MRPDTARPPGGVWLLPALTVAAFMFFSGCATLPKVSEVVQETEESQTTPQIVSARGPLSPTQSSALMERLKHAVDPTDMLERHIAVLESASGHPVVKGNSVTLLVGGEATYKAMFAAANDAKDHINIETFIFNDDETGRAFADLLLRKQAEGVQVNLIYDSVGSLGTPASFFERLRQGGIQVLEFNPINPLKAHGRWRITHRDHRKIFVVDGSVAITGGVNISEVYSGRLSGEEREEEVPPWRDADVRIEGPSVAEFQQLFLDTWQRQKGPELPKRDYFPKLKDAGKDLVMVVGSTPGEENRITFIMYVSAIAFAENSAHLTNAYFVPDAQMMEALTGAVERGVDVKIILPGMSDSSLAFYAGRYYYGDLLKAGVKLFERRKSMLHAKTAVIDGVWSTVGSTNLDFWSFASNDEVNAIILSR
ncbi:MAG TPA: phospholipase D-like domain-containing protein, partial [Thermodesulfovibrionales bacterium]|nr:phospholipase D-like domain-containing protein [Thermodesulfovibrionales bacterium]